MRKIVLILFVVSCLLSAKDVMAVGESGVAAEGAALGNGVLIQGDNGSVRKNVAVNAAGELQVEITSGATVTQYAEDSAHSSGDDTMAAGVVRADTPASLCDADGDYTLLLVDSSGYLWVREMNSAAIKAALEIIDDWDSSDACKVVGTGTAGSASSGVVTVQGIAGMTAVQVEDGGSSLSIDINGTAPALDSSNKVGVSLYGKDAAAGDTAVHVDTSGDIQADVLTLPSLPAGTNAIGKLVANDGVDIGDVTVNNGSGGSAVNIQDGGNSITVDQATADNLNCNANLQVGDADVSASNPIPVNPSYSVYKYTASDTDSSDGATFTTSAASNWRVHSISIHASGSCSADITIKFDSGTGVNYDTVISTVTDAWQDYDLTFDGGRLMSNGDEITVTISSEDSDATYCTIIGEKL